MKWLFVVLALGLLGQEPSPNGHGPYYGQNVICYRGDTQLNARPKGRVHCDCKAPCDMDENGNSRGEDKACQTYCSHGATNQQCVCHADECPHEI